MNPFDLRGPDFLLLFTFCAAAAFVARMLARRHFGEPQGPQTDYTNPYGVALLAGGPQAAIRAAVAALAHARQADFLDTTVSEITSSSTTFPLAGARDTERVHAFPQAVLARLRGRPQSLAGLETSCQSELRTLRQSLVTAGLLPTDQALGVLRVFDYVGWGVAAMGAIKVCVGLARDKPVLLLVFGLVVFSITWAISSHRTTHSSRRGEALLRDLQWDHVSLKTTAFAQPEQVRPDDIALAYGLFGVLVFGGSLTGLREVLFVGDKLWAPPPAPSEGDGGSSYSCGSSSSCGGGGGGCGGCGGGGD